MCVVREWLRRGAADLVDRQIDVEVEVVMEEVMEEADDAAVAAVAGCTGYHELPFASSCRA